MYDVNKRQRKPKEQPRMDNPETLATSSTQDTGRRQTKHKNTNTIPKQYNGKQKYHTLVQFQNLIRNRRNRWKIDTPNMTNHCLGLARVI